MLILILTWALVKSRFSASNILTELLFSNLESFPEFAPKPEMMLQPFAICYVSLSNVPNSWLRSKAAEYRPVPG